MNWPRRFDFTRWVTRRFANERPPVVLTQRRIYILPTKAGMLFGSTILVMLLGSINYNLSLGFILVFLLGGMGIAAMLHTYRGLAQLSLRPGPSPSVFAGVPTKLAIAVQNPARVARFNIEFEFNQLAFATVDLAASGETLCEVDLPPQARGLRRFNRWRISTSYPLGVFRAWSYAHLGNELLVYPAPERDGPQPPARSSTWREGALATTGLQDFSGLRRYQAGESPRAIAWKALARGHPLLSKQFSDGGAPESVLRWHDTGEGLGVEARLSRLCRWVIEAERTGQHFALELPSERIELGHGTEHVARCLRALALHDPQPAR